MKQETKFYQVVLKLAVPVTLQSLLQSSFGVVDQVMTGQLGSTSIAGIGLGSKFASVYTVLVSAVAAAGLLSTLLRCMEEASLPLYASVLAALLNTGLNYVLIFGKLGFPRMGVTGAALATVISQTAGCLLILLLFFWYQRRQELRLKWRIHMEKAAATQYLGILLPILLCEFIWSLCTVGTAYHCQSFLRADLSG